MWTELPQGHDGASREKAVPACLRRALLFEKKVPGSGGEDGRRGGGTREGRTPGAQGRGQPAG